MKTIALAIIVIAALATTIIPATVLRIPSSAAQVATQLPANIGNNTNPNEPSSAKSHLPVNTVQDHQFIVTTVTKGDAAPEGPIIVIPPTNQSGNENGTIIAPGENSTVTNPGNITIIQPGGNITEVSGNDTITPIDNETIVIAPPDRNITEVPIGPDENITVIGPPIKNETQPPATAAPCACNNVTQQPLPPVLVTPAPGQNVETNNPVLGQPTDNQTTGNNETHVTPPLPMPPVNTNASNSNQSGGNNGGNRTTVNSLLNGIIPSTSQI